MNSTMKPTKEQMYQWYVVEEKSYRQIMDLIGTKNNRKIPKLLREYGIKIRRGSEAVKTQWNSLERRKKQGEIFADCNKGRTSPRRKSEDELKKELSDRGLRYISRHFKDGYTYYYYECEVCSYIGEGSLRNSSKGCPKCANKKSTEKQRTPFEEVQKAFDENGMTLLDTEYKNASVPMAYICEKHASEGVQYRSYTNVKRIGACPHCRREEKQAQLQMSERESAKPLLRRWREAVFARDGYTCQCCGDNKGGNLQSHHILNFSDHEHLRFDIDNGITMCESCHDPSIEGSFHYIYGTRNNNERQLNEYIESRASSC